MEAARFSYVPWTEFETLDTTTQARLIAYHECRSQLDAVIAWDQSKEMRRGS